MNKYQDSLNFLKVLSNEYWQSRETIDKDLIKKTIEHLKNLQELVDKIIPQVKEDKKNE